MARPKKSIDHQLFQKAKKELGELQNSKLALKLQAIISYYYYPVKDVAKIIGVSENNIFLWIRKFKESGLQGLIDKPKGHKPALLSEAHKETICQWIRSGANSKGKKVHWTLAKLQSEINNELNVEIGVTALWNNLKKLGLTLKRPRPLHYKSDPEKQSDFKKN